VRSFRLASARSFRESWSAIQSGASSVGPSKHVGGKDTAVSIAESPVRRLDARRSSHIGPFRVQIISFAVSQTVPGKGTWDRTPPGLEPPLRVSRARRWPGRDREGRRFLRLRRFRRCTGRLNATQPGVLAVSTSYIRGLGAPCKGSAREPAAGRRSTATVGPFHRLALKVRLTLWS
jgi:hypothetical protein